MGVGYEYVDQALNGGLVLRMFVMLCVLKIAATVVSYASGNAGGIFAPSLYIGAMAGGALGVVVHTYAPFPTAAPGAYALVGMGTLFAGIIRAPMTSVFMIFEITQDYQILVPLMLANMLSFTISRRFQPVPVYHALLRQDNVHLPAASTDDNDTMVARDVMRPSVDTSNATLSIASVLESVEAAHAGSRLIVDDHGLLVGYVTHEQLVELYQQAFATLFPVTWHEPFGLVMIESMACGTPVIAFGRGSVPEVVDEGVTGFVVDSEEEAVAAVDRLEELDRRRVRARRRAKGRLSSFSARRSRTPVRQ